MAYTALYREWRPQTFADMVGQEHVSRTLQNALLHDRVAHAYLFSGPRGTGKTTTAKILAKALNCTGAGDVRLRPCNQCPNCRSVNTGSSHDVLEIDAASNRGVDEIRNLREQVKYAAQEGQFKVYIIDEVHMLTTEAFNALLKTLEEPPDNVIFVLATTEAHKIPATILSRCQRFDFRRLGMDEIMRRLEKICVAKEIAIEPDALLLIARRAEGGMRDALGILDQCVSFAGSQVALRDVTSILGLVEDETLGRIASHLGHGRLAEGLLMLNELLQQGKEVRPLLRDLLEHFRDRLLLQTLAEPGELVRLPEALLVQMRAESGLYTTEDLQGAMSLLASTENEMKWTNNPRILLEVALVRIARRDFSGPRGGGGSKETAGQSASAGDAEIARLRRRLEALESKLQALNTERAAAAEGARKPAALAERAMAYPAPRSPSPPAGGFADDGASDASDLNEEEVRALWPQVINKIQEQLPRMVISCLKQFCRVETVQAGRIFLVHSAELLDVKGREAIGALQETYEQVLAKPVAVSLCHEAKWVKPALTLIPGGKKARPQVSGAVPQKPAEEVGNPPSPPRSSETASKNEESRRQLAREGEPSGDSPPDWADPDAIRSFFGDPHLMIEFVDAELPFD